MPGAGRQGWIDLTAQYPWRTSDPTKPWPGWSTWEGSDSLFKQFITRDFDKATVEYLFFTFGAPRDIDPAIDAGRVHIWWRAPSLTTGSVRWGAAVSCVTPGDADTYEEHAFATATFQLTACDATEAKRVCYSEIILNNIDSMVPDDLMGLVVYRDATHTNDTLDEDAQVIALRYSYTA